MAKNPRIAYDSRNSELQEIRQFGRETQSERHRYSQLRHNIAFMLPS
jgi:hypothetical protein